jgi:hypothetical protein
VSTLGLREASARGTIAAAPTDASRRFERSAPGMRAFPRVGAGGDVPRHHRALGRADGEELAVERQAQRRALVRERRLAPAHAPALARVDVEERDDGF